VEPVAQSVMMPSANRTDVQLRSRAPSKTLALTIVVACEGFTPGVSQGVSEGTARTDVFSRVRTLSMLSRFAMVRKGPPGDASQ